MVGKNKINIGLIGLGYWGRNILRNLDQLGMVHTACDFNSEIIRVRKEEFPGISYTLHYKEIFKNPAVRAVAIATPSATHYQLTKQALQAGKDVFVEKPLALNSDQGEELVRLAERKKRILMVGHILQYHPAVIALKKIIKKGELGQVQYIYSNRLNIGRLRIEENILWSFAPHDISAILMLTGEKPVKVTCFGEGYLNEGIYDITLTTLEFNNEVKAHIFVSWLHPFKEQKLVVVGSKAMAVFDDLTKEKLFIYPHKIECKGNQVPVVYKAKHYPVKVKDKEPLKEEMEHFIKCVSERKMPRTNGEEGLRVLKVLEHAEESIRNKNFSRPVFKKNDYFLHPSSYVDEDVDIGEGTKIWHFSHILKGSHIGKNCNIGQNIVIGPEVTIGNGCRIQNNVSIYKGVTLEDEVFCGPSGVFTNVVNPRSRIPRINEVKPTLVKKGATIGANATIVCGHTIGSYAFVGAGAVVTKDVPDYALVYGNPAKARGWMCECGVRLNFAKNKTRCLQCNKAYQKKSNTVIRINR